MALVRLATDDPQAARDEMDKIRWRTQLDEEEKSWIWSVIAKQAGLKGSDQALDDFAKAKNHEMIDEHLFWKARVALKSKNYPIVLDAIQAMTSSARSEPVWIYWKAKALQATQGPNSEAAQVLLKSIAQPVGFYEMLAHEELGRSLQFQAAPLIEPFEMAQAKENLGLQRALAAMAIGLRSEGIREWNYTTNMHVKGGLKDPQLRAAAQLACEAQIWDRCINTSDKTKTIIDWAQRYPMPSFNAVASRSQAIGLDTAFAYGIMRQESRFISVARSGVGATGLMQVMPDTAKRFGLKDQKNAPVESLLKEPSINLEIAAKYLNYLAKLFPNRLDLILASYNAGEGAVAKYGNKIPPYKETQNYVKTISNLLVFFQSNAQIGTSQNTAYLFKNTAGSNTAFTTPSEATLPKNKSSFMVLGGAKGRGNMMVNMPNSQLPIEAINASHSLKTKTQSIAANPEFSKDNSSLKLD